MRGQVGAIGFGALNAAVLLVSCVGVPGSLVEVGAVALMFVVPTVLALHVIGLAKDGHVRPVSADTELRPTSVRANQSHTRHYAEHCRMIRPAASGW